VVGEGVPPKSENHQSPLMRVAGGRWVQHNEHKGPNVLLPGGLSVVGDAIGVKSGGVGSLEGHQGSSWATGGWLRMRRCAVAI
jgi:hypothetical protein